MSLWQCFNNQAICKNTSESVLQTTSLLNNITNDLLFSLISPDQGTCGNSAGRKAVVNYVNPKWVHILTVNFFQLKSGVFCKAILHLFFLKSFQYLYILGPLLTLKGGSAACSLLALSHHSLIKLPLESWAIITVADQHSFASHGPQLLGLKRLITEKR